MGEAVVRSLEQHGVRHVFGIPGDHTIPIYAALGDSTIDHCTVRHEQGAGFMADGYARATGEPGVAIVIGGPGLTNIATALAEAYADGVSGARHLGRYATGGSGRGRDHNHELRDQQAAAERALRNGASASTSAADSRPPSTARSLHSGRVVHVPSTSAFPSTPGRDDDFAGSPPVSPTPRPTPDPDLVKQAAGLLSAGEESRDASRGWSALRSRERRAAGIPARAPVHDDLEREGCVPQ